MSINWGLVVFLVIVWLAVAAFTALIYMDAKRYYHRPNYQQSLATTLFWPIILPILAIKFVTGVVKEMPAALERLWKS